MQSRKHTVGERLIIFTHVLHYKVNDTLLAHGPYVKEINVLANRVHELVIVAPEVMDAPSISADNIPYTKTPRLITLPVTGGAGVWEKLKYFWYGPLMVYQIMKGILLSGSILHPRSPGNVAFLSLILISLFGRKKKKFAKFAGEWDSPEALPTTFRWQRHWLANKRLFNGPVFVYSSKSNSAHIIPSFTSSLMLVDIEHANRIAQDKILNDKLVLAFAGRLVKNKGLDVLLNALGQVDKSFASWKLLVMGDGIEQTSLKKQADELGITTKINWLGWCSQESMNLHLASAHLVCQPTRFSESWGKVLQEGMAFGGIPLASAVGGLKRQLQLKPELLFEPGNETQCAVIICNFITGKLNYTKLKEWSFQQSRLYSLDALSDFTWNKYNAYYGD
jgi:glycosyltransferase involved in cell wall biosynthesis